MTAHIVDFLCTKHVMGAIKHIPWVIENKARTHRKKNEQLNEDGANYDGGKKFDTEKNIVTGQE
jgi:hypothetical protein